MQPIDKEMARVIADQRLQRIAMSLMLLSESDIPSDQEPLNQVCEAVERAFSNWLLTKGEFNDQNEWCWYEEPREDDTLLLSALNITSEAFENETL